MKTLTCRKCPKSFTKPTDKLAQQALRMHIGRAHTGIITSHSGVLRQRPNGQLHAVGEDKAAPRSHLTHEEVEGLLTFIRTHKTEYANKTACFKAALEATGVGHKIIPSSTAVNRYFTKAEALPQTPVQGEKPKRKYTRRQVPAETHVHVNFCPNCGCNMQAVAMGIAMATNTTK